MTDDFDEDGLRQAVERHWQHHGRCESIFWSSSQRDDGIWQVEVGPIFQELLFGKEDGSKVWNGFEFNLSGFFADPGVVAQGLGGASYCLECGTQPFVGIRGTYQGQSFVMKVNLEPDPQSEPMEFVDTITKQVRSIEREQS